MAVDQSVTYHVQVETLTIRDGGVEVTIPLPPEGISWGRAELLIICVALFSWTLRKVWWAANLFQTLFDGRPRW